MRRAPTICDRSYDTRIRERQAKRIKKHRKEAVREGIYIYIYIIIYIYICIYIYVYHEKSVSEKLGNERRVAVAQKNIRIIVSFDLPESTVHNRNVRKFGEVPWIRSMVICGSSINFTNFTWRILGRRLTIWVPQKSGNQT